MRGRVTLSFNFEAAHQGVGFPDDHPNSRTHGHSYIAELIAEGVTSASSGTIVDLEAMQAIAEKIKHKLDHRLLNEVVRLSHPTMECLADWILNQANYLERKIIKVRVSRPTVGMWAETEEPRKD